MWNMLRGVCLLLALASPGGVACAQGWPRGNPEKVASWLRGLYLGARGVQALSKGVGPGTGPIDLEPPGPEPRKVPGEEGPGPLEPLVEMLQQESEPILTPFTGLWVAEDPAGTFYLLIASTAVRRADGVAEGTFTAVWRGSGEVFGWGAGRYTSGRLGEEWGPVTLRCQDGPEVTGSISPAYAGTITLRSVGKDLVFTKLRAD
jgi:hypothetical protein